MLSWPRRSDASSAARFIFFASCLGRLEDRIAAPRQSVNVLTQYGLSDASNRKHLDQPRSCGLHTFEIRDPESQADSDTVVESENPLSTPNAYQRLLGGHGAVAMD